MVYDTMAVFGTGILLGASLAYFFMRKGMDSATDIFYNFQHDLPINKGIPAEHDLTGDEETG